MIVYKDMCFCMREGCGVKSCPRNLANVDWGFGLPVSVRDMWGKCENCPKVKPNLIEFEEEGL